MHFSSLSFFLQSLFTILVSLLFTSSHRSLTICSVSALKFHKDNRERRRSGHGAFSSTRSRGKWREREAKDTDKCLSVDWTRNRLDCEGRQRIEQTQWWRKSGHHWCSCRRGRASAMSRQWSYSLYTRTMTVSVYRMFFLLLRLLHYTWYSITSYQLTAGVMWSSARSNIIYYYDYDTSVHIDERVSGYSATCKRHSHNLSCKLRAINAIVSSLLIYRRREREKWMRGGLLSVTRRQ